MTDPIANLQDLYANGPPMTLVEQAIVTAILALAASVNYVPVANPPAP